MNNTVKLKIRDHELILETGKLAKQANGAILVRYGGSVVFVAAAASKKPAENIDYFPLSVHYQERSYAAGKIPGGFFKREGRPSTKEILVSRLIDRPIRPLFPKGFRYEVQITPMTLSTDQINPPDILAIIGASAALCISDIPFNGPIGAVRVGKIDNNLIINPTFLEEEQSVLSIVVAGTKNGILMVEGFSSELTEDEMIEALEFAHKHIIEIVNIQEELIKKVKEIKKIEPELFIIDENLKKEVIDKTKSILTEYLTKTPDKNERNVKIEKLFEETKAELIEKYTEIEESNLKAQLDEIFSETKNEIVRNIILSEGKRIDGRGLEDIRPINCEIGVLPRTHGSAIFTRGQTQSLVVTTLGSVDDRQRFDNIEGEGTKSFMLHYNFPPFSTGETGRVGFTSRREIGHGILAERAISKVLPDNAEFPYTIRIVSEILESNGSSSMATVCGGSLSLLNAGVPIKEPVAGVAMGLILENEKKYAILTDILGEEDHLGDMDFKVAGTKNGITAFQMDIKIDSISFDIMKKAMHQAKKGRLFILDKMNEIISKPEEELSEYAPKIKILTLPKDKIALVIGPGGSMIKDIIQRTDTNISISDEGTEGTATISGVSLEGVNDAENIIKELITDLEPGKTYNGKVRRIVDFGAFISLPGKKEGLVHISKIADKRINKVEDVLKIDQEVRVKLSEIDRMGRINLSMKDADK